MLIFWSRIIWMLITTAPNEHADTLNIRIYTTSNTDPTPDINAVCSLNASEETPTYLFEGEYTLLTLHLL